MANFHAIVQLLQANKIRDIENEYLLDEISFDHVRDFVYGDTLLHYFFRHFDEFPSSLDFNFLLNCFFRCDHLNKQNKTALHILLEFQPDHVDYFNLIKDKGFSLFEAKGNTMSIFELIISTDNKNVFQTLIGSYKLDYISQYYYEKSLCLSFKYESLQILSFLVSVEPINLFSLFNKFLAELHVPTDETDEDTANYQFFNAIKNSKKKIFKTIFDALKPNNKIITLDMLYYCTDNSFCIYLSKYAKEEQNMKIPNKNEKNISPQIFSIIKDIYTDVYNSRLIIHQAVINDNLDLIQRIPPIMYDSKDYSGDTPLIYALENNNLRVAKYLIKFGDIDFCHLGRKTTPLHLAVKGRIDILKKMLSLVNKKKYKRKFDINVKDRNQNTPLLAPFYSKNNKSIAANFINTECLKLIIQNGADIFACDLEGNNILFYSFKYWNLVQLDFLKFILMNENLTLSRDASLSLLNTLCNQKDKTIIDMFLDRFDISPEDMKIVFTKSEISNIKKIYSILKQKGKENNYFFNCLKQANEKVINQMITTIDGLLFYVDSNDNNTVLFILANLQKNSINNLYKTLTTILHSVIQNKKRDFLLIQDKKNGDNFLQVALRKRNEKLINSIYEIFKMNYENDLLKNLIDDANDLFQLISDLIYQKNKSGMNSIELSISLFYDLGSFLRLEVFEKDPSYSELEKFLEKVHNPNIVIDNEPLIIKYVKYNKFSEEEMINILKLFDKYHCDFTKKKDDEYAAKICLSRKYFNAFLFLLSHRGVGSFVDDIDNYIRQCNNNDTLKIEKSIIKTHTNFYDYYRTVEDFKTGFSISQDIYKFANSVINNRSKKKNETHYDKKEELFWPIIPIIQRFYTFNLHFNSIVDLFLRMLTYESPIPRLFEIFLPFFDDIYSQFYSKMKEITRVYSKANDANPASSTLVQAGDWMSKFLTYGNFASDIGKKIENLIKKNPNEEMKNQLKNIGDKCTKSINEIVTYSDVAEEFNNLIQNRKIVNSANTNFDSDKKFSCFRFTYVKITEHNFDISYQKTRYNGCVLICTDDTIYLASVDSDEIRFFFESSIFTQFHVYTPSTQKVYPKLKLFTKDGVIEVQQIDNLSGLRNIHHLIEDVAKKFNETFEIQWENEKKIRVKNDDVEIQVIVYVIYVNSNSFSVVQDQFAYSINANLEDVRSFALNFINLNASNEIMWRISLQSMI